MIIVKYWHDGTKCVVQREATKKDLSARYQRQKKIAEEVGPSRSVSWHGNGFEVTDDNWASGFMVVGRPDNWPITNGEPA